MRVKSADSALIPAIGAPSLQNPLFRILYVSKYALKLNAHICPFKANCTSHNLLAISPVAEGGS
jgi:hypothetical protein